MAVSENDVLEEIRDQLESIKVPGAREATPENTWNDLDVDSLDLKPIESVGDAISLTIRLVEAKEGAPA